MMYYLTVHTQERWYTVVVGGVWLDSMVANVRAFGLLFRDIHDHLRPTFVPAHAITGFEIHPIW